MNTRTITDDKKHTAEFSAGHRLAGLLALAAVALFGTVQSMQAVPEQSADTTQSQAGAASAPTPVEHYPAQVMN